jgi:hypothetical protein
VVDGIQGAIVCGYVSDDTCVMVRCMEWVYIYAVEGSTRESIKLTSMRGEMDRGVVWIPVCCFLREFLNLAGGGFVWD